MADSELPPEELQHFLSDHADALDRGAAPIDAHEAAQRTVTHSLEPARRWIHTPAVVADSARRRPAVAAAVIAALLVGSVGGFAAGRGSAPKQSNVTARGAARDSSTPSTIVSNFSAVSSGGMYAGPPVMTRLFVRTTADGVALRGYLQTNDSTFAGQPACDQNSWCPPPECNPSTFFMAELSSTEAVAQNGSPQYPLDGPAAPRGETQLGQMEGAPVSSYMVQTNSDVTNVRATWPDGFVDEMAPVNGWAIVAHSGATPPTTIEVVLGDGSVTPLKDFRNGYGYPAQCNPPPPPPLELPPAGTEQPADVASATEAVRTAFNTVFTYSNSLEDRAPYVEDQEGTKSARETVQKNYPEAANSVTVEVGEIRFLSATDAALYFELTYQGGVLFGKQVGYAKLIDGTWKVSRDTSCMTLAWGGGYCDPPPDPERSRSSGNAPPSNMATATANGGPPTTTAPSDN